MNVSACSVRGYSLVAKKPGAWVNSWTFPDVGIAAGLAETGPQAAIIKGKIKKSQCFILTLDNTRTNLRSIVSYLL
jgi:hypothetical protein